MNETKWNPNSGSVASRETDKGILVRGDDGALRSFEDRKAFKSTSNHQEANETAVIPQLGNNLSSEIVEMMARAYETERAKYTGGVVYYTDNGAAHIGCMNKALAINSPPKISTKDTLMARLLREILEHDFFVEGKEPMLRETIKKCENTLRMYEDSHWNNGWLSIETAPKDGSPILVFVSHPKAGNVWQDVVHFNDIENMFMSGAMYVGHDFITHWQPLPPAPKKSEA